MVFRCFKAVEKVCIGNEWVKLSNEEALSTGENHVLVNMVLCPSHFIFISVHTGKIYNLGGLELSEETILVFPWRKISYFNKN